MAHEDCYPAYFTLMVINGLVQIYKGKSDVLKQGASKTCRLSVLEDHDCPPMSQPDLHPLNRGRKPKT